MSLLGNLPLPSGLAAFFDHFSILFWDTAIEFVGALIIFAYVIAALWTLIRRQGFNHGITRARILVAEGAVWGLSFKVAGTLLKTLTVHTWSQFGMFALVFVLRIVVKKVFAREEARLGARIAAAHGSPPQPPPSTLAEASDLADAIDSRETPPSPAGS